MSITLNIVTPEVDAGYRRVRRGNGWRLLDASGRAPSPSERDRVLALAIPPTWRRVWIAADPHAHILAVGVDSAGRKQYLYHPDWRVARDAEKFDRALRLAGRMPVLRRWYRRGLHAADVQLQTEALALALLDQLAIRVGPDETTRSYGSRGLTTLQLSHVHVSEADTLLEFTGKAGVRARIDVTDPDVRAVLRDRKTQLPGRRRLLSWPANGRIVTMTANQLNALLREVLGLAVSAKDVRTLTGTLAAAVSLRHSPADAEADPQGCAAVAAAAALGNTPAVALASYIDPRVFAAFRAGQVIATESERALRRLLVGHD